MLRSSRSCAIFIADVSFPSKIHLTFASSWGHHSSCNSQYRRVWRDQSVNKSEEKVRSPDAKKMH